MRRLLFSAVYICIFSAGAIILRAVILSFHIVNVMEPIILLLGSLVWIGVLVWLSTKIIFKLYEMLGED